MRNEDILPPQPGKELEGQFENVSSEVGSTGVGPEGGAEEGAEEEMILVVIVRRSLGSTRTDEAGKDDLHRVDTGTFASSIQGGEAEIRITIDEFGYSPARSVLVEGDHPKSTAESRNELFADPVTVSLADRFRNCLLLAVVVEEVVENGPDSLPKTPYLSFAFVIFTAEEEGLGIEGTFIIVLLLRKNDSFTAHQ